MNEIYTKLYQKISKKVPNWMVENFYLAVISQGKVKSIKRFAQGETSCSVNPYDIGRYIAERKGDSYIVAHNHPSGRLDHSVGDMNGIEYFRKRISFPLLESMVFTQKTFCLYEK